MAKNRKARLLVVDDDLNWVTLEREVLEKDGFEVVVATSGADALDLVGKEFFDLLILDQHMRGMTGTTLLTECQRRFPDIGAIFLTGYADLEVAVEAGRLGAFEFLRKPVALNKLLKSVEQALKRSEMARENRLAWFDAGRSAGSTNIIGKSPALKQALELALHVSPTDAPILLLGETGTGKELFARLIHEHSLRRNGPYVAVNASAIAPSLVEATLFGYKKGAFTDAKEDRKGYFEAADNGTLFFDEIGELQADFQPKLLRVLESDEREGKSKKKFMRLGEAVETSVDVRLISATNRNLEEAQKAGRFKPDLFNRLAVFPITLPPLRERHDDIYPLVLYYLERHSRTLGKEITRILPEAIEKLEAYPWPGNVRELKNTIYKAVLLARSNTITADLLPLQDPLNVPPSSGDALTFKQAQLEFERKYFTELLVRAGGNKTLAAEMAKMDRPGLYKYLRKFNMS